MRTNWISLTNRDSVTIPVNRDHVSYSEPVDPDEVEGSMRQGTLLRLISGRTLMVFENPGVVASLLYGEGSCAEDLEERT